jgi:hypothetical protein
VHTECLAAAGSYAPEVLLSSKIITMKEQRRIVLTSPQRSCVPLANNLSPFLRYLSLRLLASPFNIPLGY